MTGNRQTHNRKAKETLEKIPPAHAKEDGNIRFQLDEKGVLLRSEARMSFAFSSTARPDVRQVMLFERPFLIMLMQKGAEMPYMAMWVKNPELLLKVKRGIE